MSHQFFIIGHRLGRGKTQVMSRWFEGLIKLKKNQAAIKKFIQAQLKGQV